MPQNEKPTTTAPGQAIQRGRRLTFEYLALKLCDPNCGKTSQRICKTSSRRDAEMKHIDLNSSA